MSSLALSVLLSLVSAVAYAAGAIVQERVAADGDGDSLAPLRNRVWWAAVTLNGVGAVLHVVALAYGPLSLVQPLGALTIVFALPMAALFVRRRAGATAWRGAIMTTVGLAGLLALTGNAESHALDGPDQLLLAGLTLGTIATLLLASRGVRRPVVRSVVLAGAAGVAFGIASVFTKTVAVGLTSGAVGAGLPALVAIGGFAASGLLLSQAAYRGAGLTAPLATVTVVNPVVAAVVGLTLFGEEFRHGTTGAVLAQACAVLAAGGLILLTTERLGAERHAARAVDDELPDTAASDGLLGTAADDGLPGAAADGREARAAETVPGKETVPGAAGPALEAFAADAVPETVPERRRLPLLMPLMCLEQVEFTDGRPRSDAALRGRPSEGPGAPNDAAGTHGAVQTLAPPALR
ncbi:DMT family transporter [Streptomyces sp. NPDC057496]|uniref:DMT family transporter n=1 Tax=Streptomyces sp. NPDC057496 TaxID=3346149 RepID=UPI0036C6A212